MTNSSAPAHVFSTIRNQSGRALTVAQQWVGLAAGRARIETAWLRAVVDECRMDQGLPMDQYILINNVRLHYRDWGNVPGAALEGRPVLLLHGFTGNARSWDELARRLRRRFRVIALDQRGHGESGWASDYQYERFVEDIAAFVRALDLAPVTLVGMSMGGRHAFHYAGLHPEQVARLVVGDVGPEVPSSGHDRIYARVRVDETFASPEEAVERSLDGNPRAHRGPARQRALSNLMRLADGRWTQRFDPVLRTPETHPHPNPEVYWAILPKISCPTLLIHGTESDVLASETAARMVEVIQNCQLLEIPESGHGLSVEQPDAFHDAITTFLEAENPAGAKAS